MSAKVTLRPIQHNDRNYILATMRKTLLTRSAYCVDLHPEVLTNLLESVVTLLDVVVATPVEHPDTILGFLIYSKPSTVAFVYVRADLRRNKLATRMLEHAGITPGEILAPFLVTKFDAGSFVKCAASKGYTIRFRPYLPLQLQANALLTPTDLPCQPENHD